MQHHDPKALRIAKAVQRREQPELVILFGSRARGEHEELVWRTTDEFRHNRRYVNSVETHAV